MSPEEVDRVPETEEDRCRVLDLIMGQTRELNRQDALEVRITCPCGRLAHLFRAARCLACGVWLCEPCALRHFAATSIAKGPRP